MYQNVIVPNEGSREGRSVFAPAADLAWRCGARVVFVSNTKVSDQSSKALVKQYAMSQSAADAEFWVDLDLSIADGTLQAASFRPDPVICVASPPPAPKVFGKPKAVLSPIVADLAQQSPIPLVVIGPVTETGRGLPMTELIVVVDGTADGDLVLGPAAAWADQFRLRQVFTALTEVGPLQDRSAAQQFLDVRAGAADGRRGVGVELVQGRGGPEDLSRLLVDHENAVVMLSGGPIGTRLSDAAERLIRTSPRAVVLVR